MLSHLGLAYDCLDRIELSSSNQDPMVCKGKNIYYLTLYRRSLLTSVQET